MESLYVCLFSNGHIKVGRSIDPEARIAAHASRVACMGIELAQHFIAACEGASVAAETSLIARCSEAAEKRHLDEWFVGLDYGDAVRWAADAAAQRLTTPEVNSRWRSILADLKVAGLTQTQIAERCGCDQSTVSALYNGRAREPLHSFGEKLIALHATSCPHTRMVTPADARGIGRNEEARCFPSP